MAISANTVWEVRPTNGSDTNGGGFVIGASGTDYSQLNAKNSSGSNISTTDVVTTGIATITSASASFTSAIVGNIIYLTGSGITTGWYQVATYSNATTVILDRSPGTGTGGTMNIGGALKTISQLITNFASGHRAWIKAESTITTASAINFNFTSDGEFSFIAGYTTTRGDNGQVTIQATSTSFTVVTLNNNNNTNTTQLRNFIIDCNTKTSVSGISMQSNGCIFDNIVVKNQQGGICFNIQNNTSNSPTVRNCLATNSDNVIGFKTNSGGARYLLIRCAALNLTSSAGTSTGFQIAEGNLIRCVAANNSGSVCDGFSLVSGSGAYYFENCVAYNNGRHGWILGSGFGISYPVIMENCIAVNNGGYGFDNIVNGSIDINQPQVLIDYMAFYNNTSGSVNGLTTPLNTFTLTGDPFVAGSSNNFTLNSTAGAGAVCVGAGTPAPSFLI